jgi:hypothetical protein
MNELQVGDVLKFPVDKRTSNTTELLDDFSYWRVSGYAECQTVRSPYAPIETLPTLERISREEYERCSASIAV